MSDCEPFTIVTGFFDIGRGAWGPEVGRPTDYYVECFSNWARMRNNIVVYGAPDLLERVIAVRRRYGLEDRTHTVAMTFDDLLAVDHDIYQEIGAKLTNPAFLRFRTGRLKAWFQSPEFVYLIYSKPYLVNDAIARGLTGEAVTWLDFGFGYNNTYYTTPSEFDFEWRRPLEGKFHLFSLYYVDERPIFDVIRDRGGRFQSGLMPAPARLWKKFPDLFRENMRHLLACDMPDTEQTIMTMIYRKHPEMFKVHILKHHQTQSLKIFGGEHLSVKKQWRHKTIKREAAEKWRRGECAGASKLFLKYLVAKIRREKE